MKVSEPGSGTRKACSVILTLLVFLSGVPLGVWPAMAVVDLLPPNDPTVINSPTHTAGAWSNKTTIGVNWIGGSDSTIPPSSGVGGYSLSWTKDAAALPDETIDTAVIDFNRPIIAAGRYHTVGVTADGTVMAAGRGLEGQTGTGSWTNIIAVAAGGYHTVGLKSDGTAVAVGKNDYGQINVSSWNDMVAVAAGTDHTIGLKSDGTVAAVGNNSDGQTTGTASWSDIVAVAAGTDHTVGLKSDGTVVAAGGNGAGQTGVSTWTNITAVAAGGYHTVGLKSDGTAVAVGSNTFGQTAGIASWSDIVAVAAGDYHTIGLKSDGTVVTAGSNGFIYTNVSSWSDIVAVAAGDFHTVGLKADGALLAVGVNGDGQINASSWSDIKPVSSYGVPADGDWWFNLRTADNEGNWTSTVHYGPFKIDTTGPAAAVSAPVYSTNASKTTAFKVSWSGADQASGVASYDVQRKIGAKGTWSNWKTGTVATSATFKGKPGKTYYFRARAKDNAVNTGAWSAIKKTIVPYDNNSLISKRTGFSSTAFKATSAFYRGTTRYSTASGESITYKVTGKSVALIVPRARNRSKAKIYINGRYVKTINAYAKRLRHRQVLYSKTWKKGGTRTITIENVGNRSRFDVDALGVGR